MLDRRTFLKLSAVSALASAAPALEPPLHPLPLGNVILNDDGHVFLYMNDDLTKDDLRRYLQSYCRSGVSTVAFCVGDMSWPVLHPTKVGVHYTDMRGSADFGRTRMFANVDRFRTEPGGFFGAVFSTLRELNKTTLASFRMNDAHFTTPDNPNVSEFWKKSAEYALGSAYGYYGGCLNYAADPVRQHFYDRVIEFAELYPDVDGIELDAMRSPFFFAPDKGREQAPLFTELVRRIKAALADQAKRQNRPDYLLAINVPNTPELALECGLDVAAWDQERLFNSISVGTYQGYMTSPFALWKDVVESTPVFAYVNCSVQTGQYLGLEEYRAAAANAYGAGADGINLFNYPCLFELAAQVPSPIETVATDLPDMRAYRQPDLRNVADALDEIHSTDALRNRNKRYLFYFNTDKSYRHYAPTIAGMNRADAAAVVRAPIVFYEDVSSAKSITLRFKIENVVRAERFAVTLNDAPIDATSQTLRYAPNGRDTRVHTVSLGPYQEVEIALQPGLLKAGENVLAVSPIHLEPGRGTTINMTEIELLVRYA